MQETAKDVAIDSAAGWDETTLAIFREIDHMNPELRKFPGDPQGQVGKAT